MRPLIALTVLAFCTCAQAQYPLRYPQKPPTGGPYRPYGLPDPNRTPSSMAQVMFDAHNAIRARTGVSLLVWSAQLADVAQDWANRLIATGGFAHRPDNSYGENLYAITGGTASPAQVVEYWAGEAREYDIRGNTCAGVCGHYTQLVWDKSRTVVCAVASDCGREV